MFSLILRVWAIIDVWNYSEMNFRVFWTGQTLTLIDIDPFHDLSKPKNPLPSGSNLQAPSRFPCFFNRSPSTVCSMAKRNLLSGSVFDVVAGLLLPHVNASRFLFFCLISSPKRKGCHVRTKCAKFQNSSVSKQLIKYSRSKTRYSLSLIGTSGC